MNTEPTITVQTVYYLFAIIAVLITAGTGYLRLYMGKTHLETRIKIMEDIRSEFLPRQEMTNELRDIKRRLVVLESVKS